MSLQELIDSGVNFVDRNRTALGVAGQLVNQEAAIKALEGLGDDAKQFLGLPEGGLYDTIAGDTRFKPFNVSAIPGTFNTDAQGTSSFALSPEQRAVEESLRTGGSQLVDAVLGRGQYGTFNRQTCQMEQNMRSEQAALIDMLEGPMRSENLASTEQTAFDRLQALRQPEQERAQLALNQNLIAQGRQGLRTAQFGGSPEQLALSKAIQEQTGRDALSAMQLARTDAQAQSNARLAALQQQAREKQLGANIATQFLGQSYTPQTALLQAIQPSLNIADMSTTAGRQLGQYGLGLGQSQMAYDLGAQSAATNLRNQTLKGLFDLMIADRNANATENAGATVNAAAMQGGNSSGGFKIPSVFTNAIPQLGG